MEKKFNLEALRIVSMICIIMHHYSVHGGFVLDSSMISLSNFFVQSLSAGGKLGVNCFVLIAGYFMIKSTFKLEKVLKLVLITSFYSATIYIIAVVTGYINFAGKQAVKSFFPILFDQYWFVTSYLLMYMLSPYINTLIKAIGRRMHISLIIFLVSIWSVLPTLLPVEVNFSFIGWFITLYVIAAYLRLYPSKWSNNLRLNMILSLSSYAIILLSIILFSFLGTKFDFFAARATHFAGINSLPMLFCSVTLFLWFKNITGINNKLVGIVSSSMFGVYLIHDNFILRSLLWQDVFRNKSYLYSEYLIFHAMLAIFLVFLFSIFVDQAVTQFFKIVFLKTNINVPGICTEYLKSFNPKINVLARKLLCVNH